MLPLAAWLALPFAAQGQPPLLTERFTEYDRGAYFGLSWHVLSGEWRVVAGQLLGHSPARGICWSGAAPPSADQRAEVRVTPGERLGRDGWSGAGLLLWQGESDFWRLALVEGPEGRHYAELLEMREGTWQAQTTGPTTLSASPGGVEGFDWRWGATYRLCLELTPGRVQGEVIDDATGDVLFRRGHPLPPEVDAVRCGRPALMVDAMEAAFDDLEVAGVAAPTPQRGPMAAVLDTRMPDSSREVADRLRTALAAEGLETRTLALPEAPGQFIVPDDIGLLVLPHTRRLPLGLAAEIDAYLRRGGNAIFLGGPFGDETLVRSEGQWLSVAEALAATPTERVFSAFSASEAEAWVRNHGPEDQASTRSVEASGPPRGGAALRVQAEALRGWDTIGRDFEASPFEAGQTLTCFWAKGGPRTTHLTLEWQERDGSRWMTAVRLTREWRRYVLSPGDFAYWPDGAAVGRGGAGDSFHPERAWRFACGLAKSHSPLPDGPHVYWFADLGAARPPFPLAAASAPIIEAVSPAYKTFEPTTVARLQPASELAEPGVLAPPSTVRCALPRSRGLGLKGARMGRWIPLLSALDAKGEDRGCVASLFVSMADPYPDAAWGVLGIEDPAYLTGHWDRLEPLVRQMVRRLATGVYLAKAGSDQFAYLPDEKPLLGGQIANRSGAAHDLDLRVTVTPAGREAAPFRRTWSLNAAPGTLSGASTEWQQAVEPGAYQVQVELLRGEMSVDAITQEFVRLPEPQAEPSEFVTVRDGDFHLGGKPWHPHGINYWPSNATGLEPAAYWLHWLHPSNYDPAIAARDLRALESLKLNSVSIVLGDREHLPACLHFLYLCRQHGVRANVFLGGGDPLGQNVQHAREIIEAGRLAQNPTIWAWDIAWEPHFGAYDRRRALDPQWAAWIEERYGSLAAAEADWGCAAPRTPEGTVTGPSQEQILTDGPHRVMVAAYRRCLDDLVSASYGRWARTVRAIDPRHLIGVRSGYGGTGQPGIDPQMPFDLVSGAKHLNFVSPEGYGLGGPWESFEQGGFTTEYARYAGGGKPVFWAEIGMSVHPEYTPERLEAQRLLYEHLYRMVIWSGASGSAGWWFPGGFRVGENSDYGIMHPDGSPRPSALEARDWAAHVAKSRPAREPQAWLTIDRDAHPRGYSQVWLSGRDGYVRLRRLGRRVGLRTEGSGTDSMTAPLVAVGNRPCNGSNPPKCLNAEFNLVRLRAGGDWQDVEPGSTVGVPAGRRVELFASLGNTGEALWVAPARAAGRPGGVHIVGAPGSPLPVDQPLAGDVPRFGDAAVGPFTLTEGLTAETPVALRLEARGRTPFGARFAFILRPE